MAGSHTLEGGKFQDVLHKQVSAMIPSQVRKFKQQFMLSVTLKKKKLQRLTYKS